MEIKIITKNELIHQAGLSRNYSPESSALFGFKTLARFLQLQPHQESSCYNLHVHQMLGLIA
jgi:hypothetical protein